MGRVRLGVGGFTWLGFHQDGKMLADLALLHRFLFSGISSSRAVGQTFMEGSLPRVPRKALRELFF
jgi:hypothetical protein